MDHLFLSNTLLFRGISPEEVETMLPCLNAETRQYPRGAAIYHVGDAISSLGLVLSGSVSIENGDVWGELLSGAGWINITESQQP